MRYQTFDDLPGHIRCRIIDLAPARDLATWARQPIPALGDRSLLTLMNEEEPEAAERIVLQYAARAAAHFG
jgi:hypothetical protein